MEHYQKFLTKQFLKKDLAARIVKLKGTGSLKSSCTSQGSLCNLGNSFQKKLGHGNGRGTWAVQKISPWRESRRVKNNGLLRRGRASLLRQCCNSKVLSAEKWGFLSLPFCFTRLGNVDNPRASFGCDADPRSFYKQIRSFKCFSIIDCEVLSSAG